MSEQGKAATMPLDAVRDVLKSQYRAGLAMLREAVDSCPDDTWLSRQHVNAYWQVAYHVLYFTHLYLQPTPADFRPWPGHQSDVQNEDGMGGPHPDSDLPEIPSPYSKDEVLEYLAHLDALLDDAVDALDLASPESGFSRYKVSKFEHQVVNVRHLHHHVAQLADRLRAATGTGVRWIGARRAPGGGTSKSA